MQPLLVVLQPGAGIEQRIAGRPRKPLAELGTSAAAHTLASGDPCWTCAVRNASSTRSRTSYALSPMSSVMVADPVDRVSGVLFDPDVGRWHQRFTNATAKFASSAEDGADAIAALLRQAADADALARGSAAAAFAAALLQDLIAAGATVVLRDSRLWVRWPDWETRNPLGDANLRRALVALRGRDSDFTPSIPEDRALPFVAAMTVDLVSVSPEVPELARAFHRGLSTWSMPYRGREGRSLRFICLAPRPVFAYLLAYSRSATTLLSNTWRDRLLGFGLGESGGHAFEEWAARQGRASAMDTIADRLAAIRSHLLPVSDLDPSLPLRVPGARVARHAASGNRKIRTS